MGLHQKVLRSILLNVLLFANEPLPKQFSKQLYLNPLLPEGLLCKGGLKIAVRHMSVIRPSVCPSVCHAQTHIFTKGKWRWNMPEATGVLPESAKIDPSEPCF